MSEESIRQHLRAALDAIVSREREREPERAGDAGGAGVLASACIRTMRPLVEALSAVASETRGIGGLVIRAEADSGKAEVEFTDNGRSRRTLALSSDVASNRFEVEETQYFPLSGDRASYLHCFDMPEDALHFVLGMIGSHIASRQELPEKLA